MAIADVGHLASQNDKVPGTSFNVTTEGELAAGNVGVLIIGKDNISTVDGNTAEVTSVTDSAGNFWVKPAVEAEFCNSQAAAGAGTVVSIWVTKARATLSSGATITINLSGSTTAKAVTGQVFSVGAGKTLRVSGTPANLANDGADAGSMTLSGLANIEHLFVRGGAIEGTFTTYTVSTNYTAMDHTGATTTGGGGGSNITTRGEWRILTGTTDSTDPTTAANDQSSVMLALSEVDDPAAGRDDQEDWDDDIAQLDQPVFCIAAD